MTPPEGIRPGRLALYAVWAVLLLSLALNVYLFRTAPRGRSGSMVEAGPRADAGAAGSAADAKNRAGGRPSASSEDPGGTGQPVVPRPAPEEPGDPPSFRRGAGGVTAAATVPRSTSLGAAHPSIPAEPEAGNAPAPEPETAPGQGIEAAPASTRLPATGAPTTERQPDRAQPEVPERDARLSVAAPADIQAPESGIGSDPNDIGDANTPTPPVDGEGDDRTPPVVDFIRFDPPQVTDGSAATLLIHAIDDLSGVGSIKGVVNNPSGTATVEFEAHASGRSDGLFAAGIAIPRKAETGPWYVARLVVLDRASNMLTDRFTAATAPQGARLEVLSSESDSTPPEVLSLFVDQPTVGGGERDLLRIEARDDRSGIALVRGEYWSSSHTGVIPFLCRPGADPESWACAFSVPPDAECGRWTLQSLRVTDKAENTATLTERSPRAADASFVVAGGRCDATPATLERLSLSPAVVSNDTANEIQVTAELSDPDGRTVSLTGWASGPTSTNGQVPKIYFTCVRSSTDPEAPWIGKISVAQFAAKGTWRVDLVWLKDSALSTTSYTPADAALADAVFEVR